MSKPVVNETPAIERILARKYHVAGPMRDTCWMSGYKIHPDGYAFIRQAETSRPCHRVTYEHWFGRIPDGLELDHLCRNRACCNPYHLEAVTHLVNMQRGNAPSSVIKRSGRCARGHDPDDVYRYPPGSAREGEWQCRRCHREWRAERTKP